MVARMPAPVRPSKLNPFSGISEFNPLTSLDSLQLVPIPPAPETHEPRKARRNYLAPAAGGLDALAGILDGKTPQAPKKIEVTRNVPVADEGGDEEPESERGSMPKWGR